MTASAESRGAYEFGPFRLDLDRRVLLRGDAPLALAAKSFDTLLALVEQAGSAVDKNTLLTRVWSDAVVEENSLAKAISEVRRALGEGSREPRFVATLPGHGYRFIAPVTRVGVAAPPRRVAVLPFHAVAARDDDEYLAVGLADALITRLSRLPQIVVRPTRAILKFTGGDHDPSAAGRQLEVDSVVDGTIRRAGDRVRVTAQLVNVANGAIVWAEAFDELFTGLFAIEDVIAERVASALALVLSGDERLALKPPHARHPDAYPWFVKGRFHLAQRTAADCERAIAAFERALAIDPRDAAAYSGIADAHVFLGVQAIVMGGVRPTETFPRANAALARAFSIDDRLVDAYTSRAQVSFLYDWDVDAAVRAHQQSLALAPNNAAARHAHALTLTFLGRHDAALAEIERAQQLDPLSPIINTNLGRVLSHAGRHDEAIAQLEKTLELHPDFVVARYRLGLACEAARRYEDAIRELTIARVLSHDAPLPAAALAYTTARIGRRADAETLLASLLERATATYVAAPGIAEIYLGLGDRDRALDWLERGLDERSSMLVTLRTNARYDELRDDPRFRSVEARVGLWSGA